MPLYHCLFTLGWVRKQWFERLLLKKPKTIIQTRWNQKYFYSFVLRNIFQKSWLTTTHVYTVGFPPSSAHHLWNEILIEALRRLPIKLLKYSWSLGSTEDRYDFIPSGKCFVLLTLLTEAIGKHIIHQVFLLCRTKLIQVLIVWNCTGI